MKLYLKSGQVVELKDLNTIDINYDRYGVGKFYDKETDDVHISEISVYSICKGNGNKTIEFYYDVGKMFCTNTDNVVGVEV